MEHLEMWLRRIGAAMDASIQPEPIDNLYAEQIKKTLEAAAESWHWYQGLDRHGDSASHMEYKIRWNGATEYLVQLSAAGKGREAVYNLTGNTLETERVLSLRDSLHGVLIAIGPPPITKGPSWWPAFLRLVWDATIDKGEVTYVLRRLALDATINRPEGTYVPQLGEAYTDNWMFVRLHEHMLTYREHLLPLWRALLEHGNIKPSNPVQYLPCL